MRIATLDFGTVSIRFEMFELSWAPDELSPSGRVLTREIHRDRRMPRVGHDLVKTKRLDPSGVAESLAYLLNLREVLQRYQVERVYAVATSAFREAEDGTEVSLKLSEALGFPLRVIQGTEEARLIAKGILANEPELPDGFALADVGGGSTEISVVRAKSIVHSESVALGAISAQNRFLHCYPPLPESIESQNQALNSLLDALPISWENNQTRVLIGSSGTARCLAQLEISPRSAHGGILRKALEEKVLHFASLRLGELAEIPGMDPRRADLILAGSHILLGIMRKLGAEELRVSSYSLRHGLLEIAREEFVSGPISF